MLFDSSIIDGNKLIDHFTGYKICNTCSNLVSILDPEHLQPPLVPITCTDMTKLIFHTNESAFAMADRIAASHGVLSNKAFEQLQQNLGLNVNPDGLIYDKSLRHVYRPIDHVIRDWMHVIANAGVGNTECSLVIHVIESKGVSRALLSEYVSQFTLPKKHGRVEPTWISENRLKDDTLSSFAGILLCLIPILKCFLHEEMGPRGNMPDHILCFGVLAAIVGLLVLGADDAMNHIDELQRLISMHAELFATLYPTAVKPKFHQLLHIVGNMRFIGKLLSCFVCERRHRRTKRAALHVYRHMERTCLVDMVNHQCHTFSCPDTSLFLETHLVNPKSVTIPNGNATERSTIALLRCGEIKSDDVIWLKSGTVGKVICFWASGSTIVVQLHKFKPTADVLFFDDSDSSLQF